MTTSIVHTQSLINFNRYLRHTDSEASKLLDAAISTRNLDQHRRIIIKLWNQLHNHSDEDIFAIRQLTTIVNDYNEEMRIAKKPHFAIGCYEVLF
jgi:hypothetical protein